MKRGLFGRIALFGFGLMLVLPALAEAGHSINNKAHWQREDNPFTLKVGDNVDADWNQALRRAAGDWSRSSVLNLNVVPGKTNPRQCRPTAGRIEVCSENYGDSGWLGVTAFRFKDKHIKSAIVAVNDFYFGNPSIPELDEPYARRFVMCHELGHALGLDHRSGRSCVNDHVRISRATSDPDRHDYDQLERIYNHEDDRTTIESVDAGTGSEPASAPVLPTGQEPELQGRPDVVVTNLGGGWKQVMFIDWVR